MWYKISNHTHLIASAGGGKAHKQSTTLESYQEAMPNLKLKKAASMHASNATGVPGHAPH